jgi:hypothetical protein
MITRRKFLKKAALGGVSAAMAFSGCKPGTRPVETPAAKTPADVPPLPTPTLLPSPSKTPAPEPAVATESPASTLVRTRHDKVWNGEELSGEALRQMLDTSVTALTGIEDANQAWRSLFKAGEKVAIKVNAMANGSVHPALVLAVTQRLQDNGILPEQITIYDRTTEELKNAGFPVNRTGKGVRCYSSDNDFAEAGQVAGMPVYLNRPLMECDALINMGILKGFTYGGISFAMKNHYGSVNSPYRFHEAMFTRGICGLNALPQIQGRTRLVIGDLLTPETIADSTDYVMLGGQNSILMSHDPVATDVVGLEMARVGLDGLKGTSTKAITHQAQEWLKAAGEQGLGASDLGRIGIREIKL